MPMSNSEEMGALVSRSISKLREALEPNKETLELLKRIDNMTLGELKQYHIVLVKKDEYL